MSDWKLPYEQLAGALNALPATHANEGLRMNPRFPVGEGGRIHVRFGVETGQVCDVSVGGMALYSNCLIPDGGEIALTVNNALNVHTEVVYCAPKGEWGPGNPPQHRMGLKFLSEDDGYRVAMLALEA